MWDHPRLCGEKLAFLSESYTIPGSPPPMRGKVDQKQLSVDANRITPAYAGKRQACPHTCGSRWDHPRLCGEKPSSYNQRRTLMGSPPPMRGKVADNRVLCVVVGITPAYAGKSLSGLPPAGTAEDHPRLCGEKFLLWSNSISR